MGHVDGNALAGVLSELFRMDLTAASARCAHCGDEGMLGDAMVYPAAPGTVVRCPGCGGVLATIVQSEEQTWLSLAGVSALAIPR